MPDISLSLSDELHRFVVSQVAAGQYENETEYIRALIARARQGHDRLETLLLEGLASGKPEELDAASWQDLRTRVRNAVSARPS